MHFPMKLYELVETGPADVVAWSSSGKSFMIINPDAFCNQILPKHFRHNKLTSFQRQLNLYGFQRIPKGAEAGRYRHALFERGRPDLTTAIKREPRGGSPSGGGGNGGNGGNGMGVGGNGNNGGAAGLAGGRRPRRAAASPRARAVASGARGARGAMTGPAEW